MTFRIHRYRFTHGTARQKHGRSYSCATSWINLSPSKRCRSGRSSRWLQPFCLVQPGIDVQKKGGLTDDVTLHSAVQRSRSIGRPTSSSHPRTSYESTRTTPGVTVHRTPPQKTVARRFSTRASKQLNGRQTSELVRRSTWSRLSSSSSRREEGSSLSRTGSAAAVDRQLCCWSCCCCCW